MTSIQDFQQRLHRDYKKSLALPPTYKYLYGNPIQPMVPLDTAQDGVFFIGAYPWARFATVGTEPDVPVADDDGPFSSVRYFDGARVRSFRSSDEFEDPYLRPLGLERSQCWVTEMVRVFLFKEAFIEKYRRLGCPWPERETRSQFEEFAQQSLSWLEEELALARPRLVITFGPEVAGILQKVKGDAGRNALMDGTCREFRLTPASPAYKVVHMVHPGALMQPESAANPWPRLHRERHIPAALSVLKELGLAK